jgi:hypothetical protein
VESGVAESLVEGSKEPRAVDVAVEAEEGLGRDSGRAHQWR